MVFSIPAIEVIGFHLETNCFWIKWQSVCDDMLIQEKLNLEEICASASMEGPTTGCLDFTMT